jgi:hypothetical protein
MVSFDMLSRETDELFIIGSFQVMAAWAIDRTHGYLPFFRPSLRPLSHQ